MRRVFVNFVLLILIVISFSGCGASDILPLNATFKNGTLFGSENYVVTVCFQEDKRLHNYYTDIMIKTDTPLTLKIGKELAQQAEIELPTADVWQSLTQLLSEKQGVDFVTFHRAQTTTYIINSEQGAKLQFCVIGGDYSYNTSTNEEQLVNTFAVSKVFCLEVNANKI